MPLLRLLLAVALVGLAVPAQWRRAEEPKAQEPKPGQPEQDQEPVIRLDVELVNVTCTVRDRDGGLVANLTQDDFIVREDGKPQTIKHFARETDLPLTLGLLVDVSRSQERLIEIEKDAAARFFEAVLRPKDLAFLISFGAEAELLQDLTGSPRLLREGLQQLRLNAAVGGLHPGPVPTIGEPRGTILFDAVYLAANERLRGQTGRKAVVLITDGIDQGSRVKRADAMRSAHLADAMIYAIEYLDREQYGGRFAGSDADLKKMAEETGGRLFRVNRKNTLAEIFKQIQEDLRTQYAFSYTPANATRDGGFRKIEVKTRNDDLKVQARKGYFAAGGANR